MFLRSVGGGGEAETASSNQFSPSYKPFRESKDRQAGRVPLPSTVYAINHTPPPGAHSNNDHIVMSLQAMTVHRVQFLQRLLDVLYSGRRFRQT